MTLYRKKIIRGRTHMLVYSFCLAVSAYHIIRCIGLWMTILTALAFAVRVVLRANKYAIWTTFLVVLKVPFIATVMSF